MKRVQCFSIMAVVLAVLLLTACMDSLEKVVFEGTGEITICKRAFVDCALLQEIEFPRRTHFEKADVFNSEKMIYEEGG